MKKVLAALLAVGLLAGTAAGAGIRTGILAKQNMGDEEFVKFVREHDTNFSGWKIMNASHSQDDKLTYFDSLASMLKALRSGKIDEAALPEPAAEYVVNTNSDFEMCCAVHSSPTHLALGFRNDEAGKRLCGMTNAALEAMKSERKLSILYAHYLNTPGKSQPPAETFTKIDGAETIRVAVTGDLPSLDMISPNGTPVGFNTAVLAELGRRMRLNIELVDIESGARTSALMSGRVDAVFWYLVWEGSDRQPSVPSGVLLSDSYYEWENFMHIRSLRRHS